MKALEAFRSPDVPEVHWEQFPLSVSTKDDSSDNKLTVFVSSEDIIQVAIIGTISEGTPNRTVLFTLTRQDEGFSPELLSRFANLALAIQKDEEKIQAL